MVLFRSASWTFSCFGGKDTEDRVEGKRRNSALVSYKSAFNMEDPFRSVRTYREELRPRQWTRVAVEGTQSLSGDAEVPAAGDTWRRGGCWPCANTGGLGTPFALGGGVAVLPVSSGSCPLLWSTCGPQLPRRRCGSSATLQSGGSASLCPLSSCPTGTEGGVGGWAETAVALTKSWRKPG